MAENREVLEQLFFFVEKEETWIGVNSCWIGEERARSAFGCREDRVRFLFGG